MTEKKVESQIDRFKQTARELGCDEDEAAFDEKIKAVVKVKPSVPDGHKQPAKDDESATN